MSKWIWCGITAVVLGTGILGTRYYSFTRGTPTVAIAATTPDPELPAPVLFRGTPNYLPPSTLIKELLDAADEPIVTRPEPLIEEESVTVPPIVVTGGAEESEATTLPAPSPDSETRRMPYADTAEKYWSDQFGTWFNIMRLVRSAGRTEPGQAEESEEPPMLELPTPTYYHPPHCPYGGHCPYPSAYQNR
jgi:hypothetical protein